jgi:hypothetical protein
MAINYTTLFHCKTPKNYPNVDFWFEKIPTYHLATPRMTRQRLDGGFSCEPQQVCRFCRSAKTSPDNFSLKRRNALAVGFIEMWDSYIGATGLRLGSRVTRWVYEKIAQNVVAQSIICQN